MAGIVHAIEGLFGGRGGPQLPAQLDGHAAAAHSTKADAGAGHAPGKGVGQLAIAGSGAPKAKAGLSGKVYSGFNAKTSKLDQARTTATASWYDNADGSLTEQSYQSVHNFRDAAGQWRAIDPTLASGGSVAAGRGSEGGWRNSAAPFSLSLAATASGGSSAAAATRSTPSSEGSIPSVRSSATALADAAPSGDLVSLSLGSGESIGWTLTGASDVPGVASGDTVTYSDVLPDTDVDLTSEDYGVKETLVLQSASAPNVFSFPLSLTGVSLAQGDGGQWELVDASGTVVADLLAPFAVDSAQSGAGGGAQTNDVSYSLSTVGGVEQLTMTVPQTWLDDPARVFPVSVDPTVSLAGQTETSFVSETFGGTNYASDQELKIGYDQDTPQTCRSFLMFPTSDLGVKGYHFNSVQLSVFKLYNGNSSTTTFDVELPAKSWTPTGVDWDDMPKTIWGPAVTGPSSTGSSATVKTDGDTFTGQWTTTNLNTTQFDNFEVQGGWTYYGMELVAPSEAVNSDWDYWEKFASDEVSGYAPSLIYTYTPDVAPTVTSASPSAVSVSTLTPTLSVAASDADPYPGLSLSYDFAIYPTSGSQSTPLVSSGGQSAANWTVPAKKLSWSQTYVWTVCAFDGYQCQSNPSSYEFSTSAPPPILGGTLSQDTNGHGFNAATGDYTTSATDAKITTAGPSLSVDRDYNSLTPGDSGGFGAGWSTETDAQVSQVFDTSGNVTEAVVTYPDGEQVPFGLNADGTTYSPPQGRYAILTYATGVGYKLTDKSGTTYTFGHATGVAGVSGLTQVVDHQGRAVNYTWSASSGGHITQELSAVSGRSLTFTWQTPSGASSPHITQVLSNDAVAGEAWTAQLWTYQYSGDELTGVCAPQAAVPTSGSPVSSGACTGYYYSNGSVYQEAVLDSGAQQYWPLSDPAGSTSAMSNVIADYGTGALTYSHVTLGAGPSWLAGSAATAASFDGADSVASTSSTQVATTGAFTVSAWAKLSGTSGFEDVVSQDSAKNSAFELQYDTTTGGWAFSRALTDASGASVVKATSSSAAVTGTWYFLTGVYTPNGLMQLYVNGASAGTATDTTPYTSTGDLQIGRGQWQGGDGEYFNGDISDVSTYATALTSTQVSQLYQIGTHAAAMLTKITRPNLHDNGPEQPAAQISYNYADGRVSHVTDGNNGAWTVSDPTGYGSSTVYEEAVTAYGPQHYWTLGDSAGTSTPADQVNDDAWSGTPATASYNDVTLGSAVSEFGTGTTAAQFDGASSYVQLPSNEINEMTSGTVALWFKTSTAGGVLLGTSSDPLSAGTTPGNYTPLLYIGTDGKLYSSFYAWPGSQVVSSSAVDDGKWHFVVLTAGTSGTTPPPVQVCADAEATVPAPSASATASASPCPGESASPSASASSSPAATSQALYLDGKQIGSGDPALFTTPPQTNAYVGAGFNGGSWPTEPSYSTTSGTATAQYLNGDVADVAVYQSPLTGSDVSGLWGAYQNSQGFYAPVAKVTVTQPSDSFSGSAQTDTYLYDPANGLRLVRFTNGLNETTQYGYDVDGFLDTTTDANGDESIQGHDARGNVVSTTTCQNESQDQCSTSYSTYYLDPASETDPRNDMVATSSDGRSASATDTTYMTSYAYDTSGNLLTTTDPLGHTSTNVYTDGTTAFPAVPTCGSAGGTLTAAPAGLLASTTTPGGAVTSYTYDALGDTCTVTNSIGQVTSFTYDGLGRVLTKTVGHQIVGDWPLSQTSGTAVADSSGLDNQGTASNVTWTGGVGTFNGSSSQISAGGPVLNTSASYSVSAWVQLSAIPSTYAVVATVTGANNNPAYLLYSSDTRSWMFQTTSADVNYSTDTYYTVDQSTSPSANTWYHLVAVHDASAGTDTLYVNGTFVGATAAPQSWAAAGDFEIGTAGGGLFYFPGEISSVQAYQRTLSTGQVSALYAEGRGGAPIADPSTDDLVTSYTYDGDGRVATETDPATTDAVTGDVHTPQTSYTYDDDGDVTSSTVSDLTGGDYSREIVNVYNDYDQLVQATAPEGNASTNDAGGTIPADQDGQNHTTTYIYDYYGNVETQTDAQGRTVETLYDAANNKRAQSMLNTGENGQADQGTNLVLADWDYDAAGRLASEVDDPNGLDYTTLYSYYDNNLPYAVQRTDGTHYYTETASYYDGAGDLTSQWTDNRTTLSDYVYDADKRTSSATVDPSGVDRATAYTYTTDGNVDSALTTGYVQESATSSTADGTISDTTSTYDAAGDVLTQSVVDGSKTSTTSYELDQRGLPTSETDPMGNTTYTDYDQDGRLVETQSPQVNATVANAVTATATTAPAYAITTTGYDTFGDVVEKEGPDSADAGSPSSGATADATVYGYDADGLQVTATQPTYTAPGASTPTRSESTYQYDGAGELVTATDPLAYASSDGGTVTPTTGETVTSQYTNLGQVSSQTAEDMATGTRATTTATYNVFGETVATQDPDLAAQDPSQVAADSTYNYLGQTVTSTVNDRFGGSNDDTAEADTTYDYYSGQAGYLSAVRDQTNYTAYQQNSSLAPSESYTYDNVGEVKTQTDGAGVSTQYTYDGAGRAVQTLEPDGDVDYDLYDEGGLQTQAETVSAGSAVADEQSVYNLDGEQTSSTLLQSATSSPTTTFNYDATGLLVGETQPDASTLNPNAAPITVSYGYDLDGNQTQYKDGNGNSTYTTYNAWGLPETTIEPPVSTSTYTYNTPTMRESTDSYDADGDLAETVEPGGAVTQTYSYNGFGELSGEQGCGAAAPTAARQFGYNLDGELTSAATSNTLSSGASSCPSSTSTTGTSSNATSESFGYDDRGLLTSATGSAGNSSFTYTPDGLMNSRVDASGASAYTYDSDDRLQTDTDASTGVQLTYGYNNADQLSSISYGTNGDQRSFGYTAGELTSDTLKTASNAVVDHIGYGYDDAGELTSKTDTAGASNTYSYDQAGRLGTWSATPAGSNTATTTDYSYDADSNRTQVGSDVYTYDARDELTGDGQNTYTYTPNGNLSQITKSTQSGTVNTAYTDDAYGQQTTVGGETYTYDAAGRVLSEGNGTVTMSTQYSGAGNDVAQAGSDVYSRDPGGDLVGENTSGSTASSGQLLWTDLHTDVVGAFTASGTAMAGTESYDPLGNVLTDTGTMSSVNLGYQSEFTDSSTGEVKMGARWYNPATGQFLNKDSASNSASPDTANANPFAYADGNPLNGTDPSGNTPFLRGVDEEGDTDIGTFANVESQAQIHYDSVHTLGWGDNSAHTAMAIALIRQVATDTQLVIDANSATEVKGTLDFGGKFLTNGSGTAVFEPPHVSTAWIAGVIAESDQDYLNEVLASLAYDPATVENKTNASLCGRIGGNSCGGTSQVLPQATGTWGDFFGGLGQSLVDFASSTLGTAIGSLGMTALNKVLPVQAGFSDAMQYLGVDTNSLRYQEGEGTGVIATTAASFINPETVLGDAVTIADVTSATESALSGAKDAGSALTDSTSVAAQASRSADLTDLDTVHAPDSPPDGVSEPAREPTDPGQRPGCLTPNSFTGSTSVLMADGSTKPISQVQVGDKIADSVPGASGVQDNTVTDVITTYTDRDFVDVTVKPVRNITTASAATTSTPDAASTTSSARTPASPVVAATKRASLAVAGGLGALALLLGGAGHPATGSAGNAATSPVTSGPAVAAAAWSRDDAAPTADAQQQARQATAAATTAAARAGGGTITTTFLHPFYDETQTSFVEAEHLHVGDILQTPTGTAQITNLHLYYADTTTYDLTIGNLHTFYIVAGSTPVLVHNCGGGGTVFRGLKQALHDWAANNAFLRRMTFKPMDVWLSNRRLADALNGAEPPPNYTVGDLRNIGHGNALRSFSTDAMAQLDDEQLMNSVNNPTDGQYMAFNMRANPEDPLTLGQGNHRMEQLLAQADDPESGITDNTPIFINENVQHIPWPIWW